MGDALKKQKISTSQVWFAVFLCFGSRSSLQNTHFCCSKGFMFCSEINRFFKLTTISPSVEKASKRFPERWQPFRFLLLFVVSGFFLHCKVDISAVVDDSRFVNCFCFLRCLPDVKATYSSVRFFGETSRKFVEICVLLLFRCLSFSAKRNILLL